MRQYLPPSITQSMHLSYVIACFARSVDLVNIRRNNQRTPPTINECDHPSTSHDASRAAN